MLLLVSLLLASCRGCADKETPKEVAVPDPVIESYVTITSLGGSTPVQGEGKLQSGAAFYFRARYEGWEFLVGTTVDQAIDSPAWRWEEPFGDTPFSAGYMRETIARAIIRSCAEMFAHGITPPVADKGVPDDEVKARSLAQFLFEDVATYHQGDFDDAGVAGLKAPIEESRALYKQKVDAKFHPVFDEVFADLPMRMQNHAVHPRWLRDADSALSVQKRWTAMLRGLPEPDRSDLRKSGAVWFPRWTQDERQRATLMDALRP